MAASFTQIIFMVVIHCSYGLSFNFGPKFPELSKRMHMARKSENFMNVQNSNHPSQNSGNSGNKLK